MIDEISNIKLKEYKIETILNLVGAAFYRFVQQTILFWHI